MNTKWMLTFAAALAVSGCSAVSTTTDSVSSSVEGVTDSVSSVTGSTSGGGDGDSHADARRFVNSQFAMVRRDAAAGGGEHTATLARLMGESDAEAFGVWMQKNYAELFADLDEREMLVERIRRSRALTTEAHRGAQRKT